MLNFACALGPWKNQWNFWGISEQVLRVGPPRRLHSRLRLPILSIPPTSYLHTPGPFGRSSYMARICDNATKLRLCARQSDDCNSTCPSPLSPSRNSEFPPVPGVSTSKVPTNSSRKKDIATCLQDTARPTLDPACPADRRRCILGLAYRRHRESFF